MGNIGWNGSGHGGYYGASVPNGQQTTDGVHSVSGSTSTTVNANVSNDGGNEATPRHVIWPYYLRSLDI